MRAMPWRRNIPNYLTWSRLAAAPLIAAAFYLPGEAQYWCAAGLFLYAAITDYLDGYLARRWQAGTDIGKILDPIADKVLVAAALIPLAAEERASLAAVLVILLRELLVSGLRENLMAHRIVVPVSRLAKWKTGFQLTAITILLIGPLLPLARLLGESLLWAAAALTLVTGVDYCVQGGKRLRATR